MMKRLVNAALQLHVQMPCDDAASQQADESTESSLFGIFQATAKPPGNGNCGTFEVGLCLTRGCLLLCTVVWRSTGLVDKPAVRHHRVPIASRDAA